MKTTGKYASRIRMLIVLSVLSLAGQAQGQYNSRTERLEKVPDPVEAPSTAEIDALESKAQEGDWTLKQQFAAAYLYEHQKNEYWNWGCHHLQHGHVCRAMATRTESGQRFLREIIDLDGNGPVDKNTLARFQSDFAHRRLLDARPEFSPQHPGCQEAVRYYERAIENEFAYWGKSCVALALREKYWHGQCVKKNIEKANYFTALSVGCPRF
ncbi:MAG: hypothetical protein RLZZ298_1662 [Pseudomonadota bacterium]|jgi:hypothetical protein